MPTFVLEKNGAVLAESGNSSNFNEIPRTASSPNGGPRLRVAFMPVDYKGGEHSKLVFRSFVTPQARLFYYKGDYLIRETVSFFISIYHHGPTLSQLTLERSLIPCRTDS